MGPGGGHRLRHDRDLAGIDQTWAHDPLDRRVSTVGRAHPHVELKIVDPVTGDTVPRGASGELYVRGYSVMLGYWNQPDKTAETVDPDGWIHSGDLAVMDEEGYVALTGRIKDMVIRGGENIHRGRSKSSSTPTPTSSTPSHRGTRRQVRRGADGVAATARRRRTTGRGGTARLLQGPAHALQDSAYVHCVDRFPMTASGKIRKVEMREHAVDMLGLTP